jgi:hypothetical protein
MRLDIPVWIDIQDECFNEVCSTITQTSYVNILTPSMLINLGIGGMFAVITYLIYRHESKKNTTVEIKSCEDSI